MTTHRNLLTAAIAAVLLAGPAALALDAAEMKALLTVIDDRQRNGGDYKSTIYLEQKEKDKTDVAREGWVYRRDADDKLMILFTKPKGEAGKGYLRMDKNLWSYDPNSGKWERRTERERIAGTDSRRADFDESRLAEEFDPTYEGEGTLGKYKTHLLTLKAKPDVDVAYPVVKLWVDQETSNVLKRQEFALSGRLMRTALYPKWRKVFSESKKSDVWYPPEMYFYDEVEKANSTIVLIKDVDLRPLEANIFTKAWLESKSR
ncbi:outer membrane lipoprotein-sorting protein [Myxococcaceae bacterium GXIMD 01537]